MNPGCETLTETIFQIDIPIIMDHQKHILSDQVKRAFCQTISFKFCEFDRHKEDFILKFFTPRRALEQLKTLYNLLNIFTLNLQDIFIVLITTRILTGRQEFQIAGSQGPDQGVGEVRCQMEAIMARWDGGTGGKMVGLGTLGWDTRQAMGFQSEVGFQTMDWVTDREWGSR